jgi:hypothetical protein
MTEIGSASLQRATSTSTIAHRDKQNSIAFLEHGLLLSVDKGDGSFDKGPWLAALRAALVPEGGMGAVSDTLNPRSP